MAVATLRQGMTHEEQRLPQLSNQFFPRGPQDPACPLAPTDSQGYKVDPPGSSIAVSLGKIHRRENCVLLRFDLVSQCLGPDIPQTWSES